MKMDIEGFSFYKCLVGCEYYFAVQFKDIFDDSNPYCCPNCGHREISFVCDKEKGEVIE